MIHCFSGWGLVRIAALRWLQDAFPHSWNVFSSSRMLNRALKGFLSWLRRLEQGRNFRLLLWWLSRREINCWCNPYTMQTTVVSLNSLWALLIPSLSARSKGLYALIRWRCSEIGHGGTWATQLTWMVSICFACRLFNSMLDVIIPAMYRNLIRVYSEFLLSELR